MKLSWLGTSGKEGDIVLSSRVRLARNIEKIPFPQWAKKEELAQARELIKKAIISDPRLKKLSFLCLEDLPPLKRQVLVEEHLISPQFGEENLVQALSLSKGGTLSIMINEEDHLRIQSLFSGLSLFEAWASADEIDDRLSLKLKLAFNEKWGYLTVCPTNVGTAMRASVMAHLPALFMGRQVNQLFGTLSKVGVTVRGLFGEGTQALGNLFQISNQITLGQTEAEIIENLKSVSLQVVERERTARKLLLKRGKLKVLDQAYRALGILSQARLLNFEEALELLSMVRLGVDLGLIDQVNLTVLNELIILIRPAHLQRLSPKELKGEELDVARANLLREKLGPSKRLS